MKKTIKYIALMLVLAIVCLGFTACSNSAADKDLWDDAVYTENQEFGNGTKTISVEVKAEEKSVTFTIKTDKETVGEALSEHKLISGEEGPYGLYIKLVNGIKADYNENQSYWSFTKGGEYMSTGVDVTKITDGEHYELVYTK